MKYKLAAAILITLFASSFAYGYTFTNCAGAPCYWDKWPVSYYISSTGTEDLSNEVDIIQKSFSRWEVGHQTLCGVEFSYEGRINIDYGKSDSKNVIAWVESGWEYGSDALAVTQCWHYENSSEFLDCDILINEQNYTWNDDPKLQDGSFNLRATLTHEIGHFWGLDHTDLQQATMYAYYDDRFNASDLDYDDILGARDYFCPDEDFPADDANEENDTRVGADFRDDGFTLNNQILYDDDWFRILVKKGKRIKVTILDDDLGRSKIIYLATRSGEILEGQPCDGDCAVALLDPDDDSLFGSSAEKDFNVVVSGEFDENPISIENYHIKVKLVDPGEEGELYDDDDDLGADGFELCGCDQGGAFGGSTRNGMSGPAMMFSFAIVAWALYRRRFARR